MKYALLILGAALLAGCSGGLDPDRYTTIDVYVHKCPDIDSIRFVIEGPGIERTELVTTPTLITSYQANAGDEYDITVTILPDNRVWVDTTITAREYNPDRNRGHAFNVDCP